MFVCGIQAELCNRKALVLLMMAVGDPLGEYLTVQADMNGPRQYQRAYREAYQDYTLRTEYSVDT